jgi:ADP-glucose pyrophosphorylase
LRTAQQIAAAEAVPLDRGARTVIAASARVEHSVLWDDVTVSESAELSHCVVTDGVVIPRGARYHRAVITDAGSVPL